jgi:ABC-type multidrug transport system fused ATPase/permease subunit
LASGAALQRDDGARNGRSVLVRLFAYARPFAALILVSVVLVVALSGGRYARAYLMKPIFDDVLLPQQTLSQRAPLPAWLREIPFLGGDAPPETPTSAAPDPVEEARREALGRHIRESLAQVVVAAVVLIAAMPLVMFARAYLVEYVLARVHIDIIRDVCAKLLALPLGYHHERARGDVLARTIQDTTIANRGVRLLFGDLIEAVVMIAVGGVALFLISWQLALISLIAGPAVFGVISVFSRLIRTSGHRRQEKVGDVTGRLVEILAGIKVIKAFRAEPVENRAFRRETQQLFRRGMRVVKYRVLARSLIEMLNNGVLIGLLLLGIALVMSGRFGLTPGALAAFALMLLTTYRPLRSLAADWVQLMDTAPSAERVFAVFDTPEEIADAPDAVRIDGVRRGVAFRGVSFSYGREPVLADVSFEVKAGEAVALVGRTGAGKTTLADLLMRFYDPTSGGIEIDGVDLRGIARESLLAQIAVVTQEPFLFDGTIRDNIRYGRIDASEEEVLAAGRAAYVDEFAGVLPQGYDTEVGAAGVRLSGGQRQRITIARALLKNPAILIFDEATSALDSKSEQFVQAAIESLFGGRTVFMIAHRFSTLRRADRIVVLEGGRVSQTGTHADLIREGGLYRELIDLQAISPPAH